MGLQFSCRLWRSQELHSSHYSFFSCPVSQLSITARASSQREPRMYSALIKSASRQGENTYRAQSHQPVAIKVLLHRGGKKNLRPPEGQRKTQLPACHILSARVILGNKTALTHLCTGCGDPRGDCGCYHKNKNFQLSEQNFLFLLLLGQTRKWKKIFPG